MKRRWVFRILILAFVWLLVSRFAEVEKLAKTLAGGKWEWVLVAALLQALYYSIFTAMYWSAFETVGLHWRYRELLPLTFVSIFVNVMAPTGSVGGAALFADDVSRRGQPGARAIIGALLALIADLLAFTVVLAVGMIYLFRRRDLQAYEITGALALAALIGGIALVMLLGLWRPHWLSRFLHWLQRLLATLAARLHRPPFLDEGWADHNAEHYTDASAALARQPLGAARTLGIAMIGHIVDLISLYFVFLAFSGPVSLGVLIAAYAMGILFWIVSPTPQGVGVVEGVMALVIASLGVPASTATVIALGFRGLTFWIPLFVGFLLLRRVKAFQTEEQGEVDVWSIRIAALLTAFMGVVNILSAATPSLVSRLAIIELYLPLAVRHGTHLAAALAGFALVVLARGLARRKHTAWVLTIAVLITSIVAHLVKGFDVEEAFLATLLLIWLIRLRSHFQARSDPPSMRQGVLAVVLAFAFTLTYGVIGFYLLDRHFSQRFAFLPAVRQTLAMFIEFYNPGLEPTTGFGRYFASSIYAVGGVTLGYALLSLLKPVFIRQAASPAERERAQRIIEAHGRSTMARMLLFADKAYFFSPGGSVIGYAVRGRMAVALGDPIGPAADNPAAILAFKEFCQRNDWQCAFYQTLPDHIEAYDAAGFDTLCIGHEGIVHLSEFNLSGKSNKSIRSAINRLAKLGYRAEVHQPPLSDHLLHELQAVSDAWLQMVHGNEKRFSLGWFDEDYIRQSPVIAIHAPDGTITAFANIIPEYQRNESSIDLMRRRPETEPGTMDMLFTSLFQWALAQGYETFNLGLSPLAGVGDSSSDPMIERAIHFIYEHVNQFYNFKGLHDFKEKFHPEWSPRYLAYPGPASLLAVEFAITRASSGDFFVVDYIKDLLERPKRPGVAEPSAQSAS